MWHALSFAIVYLPFSFNSSIQVGTSRLKITPHLPATQEKPFEAVRVFSSSSLPLCTQDTTFLNLEGRNFKDGKQRDQIEGGWKDGRSWRIKCGGGRVIWRLLLLCDFLSVQHSQHQQPQIRAERQWKNIGKMFDSQLVKITVNLFIYSTSFIFLELLHNNFARLLYLRVFTHLFFKKKKHYVRALKIPSVCYIYVCVWCSRLHTIPSELLDSVLAVFHGCDTISHCGLTDLC